MESIFYAIVYGSDVKAIIRQALENKRHWVVEVYYEDRTYPNVISGRYERKKDAIEAWNRYVSGEKEFCFWGNV